MPIYRSIAVSLVSQFDLLTIPEFFPSSERPCNPTATDLEPSVDEQVQVIDPDNSVVSVYIPTYPGSQFWISYSISPPYPPRALFYFKLYLNNVHVVSWGVSEREHYEGRTMFGLYDCGDEWNELGDLEKRALCFGMEEPDDHHGQDVLEIRVYRSKSRMRITQKLPEASRVIRAVRYEQGTETRKPREGFGIDLFSAGKTGAKHPSQFYQYALLDPLDQPFATFRYHCRSWGQLEALGLTSNQQGDSFHAEDSFFSDSSGRVVEEEHYSTDAGSIIRSTDTLQEVLDTSGQHVLVDNPVQTPLVSPAISPVLGVSSPSMNSPHHTHAKTRQPEDTRALFDWFRRTPTPATHSPECPPRPNFTQAEGGRSSPNLTPGRLRDAIAGAIKRRKDRKAEIHQLD